MASACLRGGEFGFRASEHPASLAQHRGLKRPSVMAPRRCDSDKVPLGDMRRSLHPNTPARETLLMFYEPPFVIKTSS